jgi:hypothetical protein
MYGLRPTGMHMKCPVCGDDCLEQASDMIALMPTVFTPCPDCRAQPLDKTAPPPRGSYHKPCRCGKRFIDEVYAHLYEILVREGIFSGKEPLKTVGTPLVHPGFAISAPPYLPKKSLVLLSREVDEGTAVKMLDEVPEIRAVVKFADFTPGVVDPDLVTPPKTYDLLAGCDVRADIYPTTAGPLVLYQQQSKMHIEFPRFFNPKIQAVETRVTALDPQWFVDAFSGTGKLGLTAARMGVPHVVLNDAWYAAAFWSGYNILVNREFFLVDEVRMLTDYESMEKEPVGTEPRPVAITEGQQEIMVYQGDFRKLYQVLPAQPVLAALDVFEKEDKRATGFALQHWYEHVTGEAFIP